MATVAHKNLTGTDLHEPKGVAAASANQIYIANGSGSGTWSAIPDVAITSKTALTAPAVDDELVIYDLSTTTNKKITLQDVLEVLNVLTEDSSPVPGSDYLLSYDASASTVKKVKISAVQPDGDGGILEVAGTWTPALAFGGATTGITYTTQVGRYSKLGSVVTLWGRIVLSNNGSASGAATITGLPYTSSNITGLEYPGAIAFDNVSTTPAMGCSIPANSSTINLYKATVGQDGMTTLSEGNCDNTFEINFTISYRTG